MGCKFLDSEGKGSAAGAIQCIDYGISKGAKVMSNSWGGRDYSQTLKDAIEAANAAGVSLVAAAGNDGLNIDRSPE